MECTIRDETKLEQNEINVPWLQPSFPEERVDLLEEFWALYVDGLSNVLTADAGLILINLEGFIAKYALHFEFLATNNVAKYEALIIGLKIAKELEVDRLQVYSDS